MTDTNQYAERDPMELDRDGNYYCRHVSAMTAEGLHKKSDIAAELAWRDREIDRLTALSARASAGEGGELTVDVSKVSAAEATALGNADFANFLRYLAGGELHESSYQVTFAEAARRIATAAPQPAQAGASGVGELIGHLYRVAHTDKAAARPWESSGTVFVAGPAPVDGRRGAIQHLNVYAYASPATGMTDCRVPHSKYDPCHNCEPDDTPQPAAAQGGYRKPWRNHDAAMDAKALATAQEIALMWGQDRSQFVSRIQVAVLDAMRWIAEGSAAPQPQEATATFLGFKITEAPGLPDGVVYVTDGKGNPLPPGAFTVPVTPPAHGDGEGVEELNRRLGEAFKDDPANAVRAHAAVLPLIRALTTRPTPEAQEARDAARYRWLRERWGRISETYMGESSQMDSIGYDEGGWEVDPTSLDGCIDAALALPAQGEG